MITGVQPKILVSINENGEMSIDPTQVEMLGLSENKHNWQLVRERDSLTKTSRDIMWVEWNEEGRFKAKHDKPALGRSLLMSPFNEAFTWQTTLVTEIVEERDDYVKFHTTNSTYELRRLYDAATGNPV